MNKWKPINTAPTDRRILLAYTDRFLIIGMYHSHRKKWLDTYDIDLRDHEKLAAWQELPVFDGVIAE